MKGFPHERLDAWQAGLELACRARALARAAPAELAWVADELVRSAGTVGLEVAAGASEWSAGRARRRFQRARAAASRCGAAADLARALDLGTAEQAQAVRCAALEAEAACGRLVGPGGA